MAATAIPEQDLSDITQPHALELLERAQIDLQISTAKQWPRTLSLVKRKMLEFATLDEDTAEACFYTLSREGKTIQGPSVRLAEIAVACYGNLRIASRIIDNDGKAITSQGMCHDLESNTAVSVEVRRRITNKSGKTYSEDMQVVTGNAANAIAFRNAVFKVIPGALVRPVYEAAKQVAVGDASTLSTKRGKIIARLNAMQVPTEKILAKLGKASVEDIGLDDLETLIGLGTAIKDGDTTVDEAFATVADQAAAATQGKTDELREKLARAKQTEKNAPLFSTDEWRDLELGFREAAIAADWKREQIETALGECKGTADPLGALKEHLDVVTKLAGKGQPVKDQLEKMEAEPV